MQPKFKAFWLEQSAHGRLLARFHHVWQLRRRKMDKRATRQTITFMILGGAALLLLGIISPDGLLSGRVALGSGAGLLVAAAALFIWNKTR
jgi:multisubunit Na+/H+ antiporter MnhB subunit